MVVFSFFLRAWDGDLKKLPNIKMRKLSSKDALGNNVEKATVEAEKDFCAEEDTAWWAPADMRAQLQFEYCCEPQAHVIFFVKVYIFKSQYKNYEILGHIIVMSN